MKLINIGFGSMEAKDRGMLIDASYGRATKTVILMDTDHVILSALTPDVLAARWQDKQDNEGDKNDER